MKIKPRMNSTLAQTVGGGGSGPYTPPTNTTWSAELPARRVSVSRRAHRSTRLTCGLPASDPRPSRLSPAPPFRAGPSLGAQALPTTAPPTPRDALTARRRSLRANAYTPTILSAPMRTGVRCAPTAEHHAKETNAPSGDWSCRLINVPGHAGGSWGVSGV